LASRVQQRGAHAVTRLRDREVQMMNMLLAVLVAGMASFAAISPSAAQSSEAALVKIAFPFIAGDKILPAGSYMVSGETRDWTRMRIASLDGKTVAVVRLKTTTLNPLPGIEPRFWFTNYYGQYFLQRVAMPGFDVREVPLTKADAERTLTRLNLMRGEGAESVR
jgi:hypothetical protein